MTRAAETNEATFGDLVEIADLIGSWRLIQSAHRSGMFIAAVAYRRGEHVYVVIAEAHRADSALAIALGEVIAMEEQSG
jgi:hypothetical protein